MAAIAESLTHDRLCEALHYNQKSGIFTWKKHLYPQRNGRVAGKVNPQHGYIVIGIDAWPHLAHRLAWLYMYKTWPTHQIDHKDGTRTNNKFNNLRDVSNMTNVQNIKKASKNNKTGFLGVQKAGKKFRARIFANGEFYHLGMFSTIEQAHESYIKAKRILHQGCTI